MGLTHKLTELWEIESIRYRNKGIVNTLIAVFLLLCILKSSEMFCRTFWPQHI